MNELKQPLLGTGALDFPISINSSPTSSPSSPTFFSSSSTAALPMDEKKNNNSQRVSDVCEQLEVVRKRIAKAERIHLCKSISLVGFLSSFPSLSFTTGASVAIYFLNLIRKESHSLFDQNSNTFYNQPIFNNQTGTNQTCYEIMDTTLKQHCIDITQLGFIAYAILKQMQQSLAVVAQSAQDFCQQLAGDACTYQDYTFFSALGMGLAGIAVIAGSLLAGEKIASLTRPYRMRTAANMIGEVDKAFLESLGIDANKAPTEVMEKILDKKVDLMIKGQESYEPGVFTDIVADCLKDDERTFEYVRNYFKDKSYLPNKKARELVVEYLDADETTSEMVKHYLR